MDQGPGPCLDPEDIPGVNLHARVGPASNLARPTNFINARPFLSPKIVGGGAGGGGWTPAPLWIRAWGLHPRGFPRYGF